MNDVRIRVKEKRPLLQTLGFEGSKKTIDGRGET